MRWPGRVKPGVSDALVGQVNLLPSLATLTGQKRAPADAPDTFDMLDALLGARRPAATHLVEQAQSLCAHRVASRRPRSRALIAG